MMPEILGVPVAKFHYAPMPGNYTGFANHVQTVKKQQETQLTGKKKVKGRLYDVENQVVLKE